MYSVCILIYVSIYLYSYPPTNGISRLAAATPREECEVCLKMTIEWTQRYNWRRSSCELRDVLGHYDWASLEMHWEAVIEWTQRCTWRPWLSEVGDSLGVIMVHTWRPSSSRFGDAVGCGYRVNSEIHFEAIIRQVWRYTWRPQFCQPAGRDWANLELHLEAIIIQTWRVWSSMFRDTLGSHSCANLEATTERVWWCTWIS